MTNARKRILQMLADGRITVDEADELLAAIGAESTQGPAAGAQESDRGSGQWSNIWSEIDFDFDGLGERIHQSVLKGLERVEQELRDLELRMRRDDWPRSWRMSRRSRGERTDAAPSAASESAPTPAETAAPPTGTDET